MWDYGLLEGASKWLFHFYIIKSAASALYMWLVSNHKTSTRVNFSRKTATHIALRQVVNCMHRVYATDRNIANNEDKITTFSLKSNRTRFSPQYAMFLVARTVCCEDVYKEQELNQIFIKRLHKSMWKNRIRYWPMLKVASPYNLTFSATSLLML